MGILGANYLTTIFGVIAALAGGLAALPNGTLPVGWQGWLQFLFVTAASSGLIAAKSHNVTNAPVPAEAAIVTEPKAKAAPLLKAVPTRTIKP
jgi:hypothetical protein